jgi:hypothetical protein
MRYVPFVEDPNLSPNIHNVPTLSICPYHTSRGTVDGTLEGALGEAYPDHVWIKVGKHGMGTRLSICWRGRTMVYSVPALAGFLWGVDGHRWHLGVYVSRSFSR